MANIWQLHCRFVGCLGAALHSSDGTNELTNYAVLCVFRHLPTHAYPTYTFAPTLFTRLAQHQDKHAHERHRQDSALRHCQSQSRPEVLVFVAWLGFHILIAVPFPIPVAPTAVAVAVSPVPISHFPFPKSIICMMRATGENIKCA